jgi:hypothetical protein
VWNGLPLPVKKSKQPAALNVDQNLLKTIQGLQRLKEWKALKQPVSKLDQQCGLALKEKFQAWKLKKSKDKNDKKLFNQLNNRLKNLE